MLSSSICFTHNDNHNSSQIRFINEVACVNASVNIDNAKFREDNLLNILREHQRLTLRPKQLDFSPEDLELAPVISGHFEVPRNNEWLIVGSYNNSLPIDRSKVDTEAIKKLAQEVLAKIQAT